MTITRANLVFRSSRRVTWSHRRSANFRCHSRSSRRLDVIPAMAGPVAMCEACMSLEAMSLNLSTGLEWWLELRYAALLIYPPFEALSLPSGLLWLLCNQKSSYCISDNWTRLFSCCTHCINDCTQVDVSSLMFPGRRIAATKPWGFRGSNQKDSSERRRSRMARSLRKCHRRDPAELL